MHKSSFDKMSYFANSIIPLHFEKNQHVKILDIGSQVVSNQEQSYKELFNKNSNHIYEGCDIEKGLNVDIVMDGPYHIPVEDNSYDIVISGQTFEHVEYFWITALEIARVIKQNGLLCIIAPGAGQIHRFPVDCWRYYPDGMDALIKWIGFEKIETSINLKTHWQDCALIAKKPTNWSMPYKILKNE